MKNEEKRFNRLSVSGLLLPGVLIGGGVVLAKTTASYPLIVQKLAERFNLQPKEVNKVFEEVRQKRWQQRETWFKERLNAAVKAGTITKAQREAILKKRTEIQKEMEALKTSNLTPQQRLEKMAKLREEMWSWAEKNKIDLSLCLGGGFGPGVGQGKGGQGFGGGFGRGNGSCPIPFGQQ